MFGFLKNKKKIQKNSNEELTNETFDYFKNKVSYEVKNRTGTQDYSFFNDFNGKYVNEKSIVNLQETVFKYTAYNAIKEAICDGSIDLLEPYLKDLSTVPIYQEEFERRIISAYFIQKLQKMREKSVLDNSRDIREQLEELRENVGDLYDVAQEFGSNYADVITKQDYAGGKDQGEKTVEEVFDELEKLLAINVEDYKLKQVQKALIAYALNYEKLYIESEEVLEDGTILDNVYKAFLQAPYSVYFMEAVVRGNRCPTIDVLIAEAIISSEQKMQLDLNKKLDLYIAQKNKDAKFKENMILLSKIYSLYDLKEQSSRVDRYIR